MEKPNTRYVFWLIQEIPPHHPPKTTQNYMFVLAVMQYLHWCKAEDLVTLRASPLNRQGADTAVCRLKSDLFPRKSFALRLSLYLEAVSAAGCAGGEMSSCAGKHHPRHYCREEERRKLTCGFLQEEETDQARILQLSVGEERLSSAHAWKIITSSPCKVREMTNCIGALSTALQ